MQTVRIRLRKPHRVLTFRCSDIPLQRNDPCIVRTDQGLEYGVCVVASEPCAQEVAERYQLEVVRKAGDEDKKTLEQLLTDEAKARAICAERIAEKRLPMNHVDAEYTFDHNKVVFYFTADERVDFRELVRDLAHTLKARIELRHIQVRDQAMMVGGIGECGRVLCCRTWLREFMPISMKMAKRQNLSLNPEKISGQCGRLMCCLSYENNQYEDKKKKAPLSPAAPEESAEENMRDDEEIELEEVLANDLDSREEGRAERAAAEDRAVASVPPVGAPGGRSRRRRKRRRKQGQGGAEAAPPGASP